jgi:uncharacterized protein (DUF58 family)
MNSTELIKQIRRIEIKSKGLSNQLFSGEYHSAFKGKGMAFSEVREYRPGDEIRSIDWNVTARFGSPYVKIFEEEREMTVMLLVDVSGSGNFGSRNKRKRDVITELCATLAFSTIQNNDKIGVIFFSDRIEKYIPPKKGRKHVLHIIREMIDFVPQGKATNLLTALQFMNNLIKKRSTVFVISDFISPSFDDAFKVVARRHDLIPIRVNDEKEYVIPDAGLIKFFEPESGKEIWFDSSDKNARLALEGRIRQAEERLQKLFTSTGTNVCKINTVDSFVVPLVNLFRKRGAKM